MMLENGAGFSMVLTEEGSPRLNVRDVIRVAAGPRSALIDDQCSYRAEGLDRVLRRARTRRADSFDLRVSGTAALDIQDLIDESRGQPGRLG